jgi:hypothetical protein
VPFGAYIFFVYTFLDLMCDSFCNLALSLYLTLNIVQDQILLFKSRRSSSHNVEKAVKMIQLLRFVLSRKAMVVFMLTAQGAMMAFKLSFFIRHPDLFAVKLADVTEAIGPVMLIENIIHMRLMISLLFFIILAWRLRLAVDAHGLKSSLKRAAVVTIGLVTFSGTEFYLMKSSLFGLSFVTDTIFGDMLFYV